ncbi:hypothetical protein TYRP_005062 [Tyrophagus putrescentiae]|nr:hypothetical protein TYRP_005062 [Tyrophagus putrescentiae]
MDHSFSTLIVGQYSFRLVFFTWKFLMPTLPNGSSQSGKVLEHSLFIEVDSVMGETTGVTTTAGMLAVLANATMAVGDVAAQLTSLGESSRL